MERVRIAEFYLEKYGRSLMDVFDDEIKGDALDFYKTLYSPYYENWAIWINECIASKKDDLK